MLCNIVQRRSGQHNSEDKQLLHMTERCVISALCRPILAVGGTAEMWAEPLYCADGSQTSE